MNRYFSAINTKAELLLTPGPSNFTLLPKLSFQNLDVDCKEKFYYFVLNKARYIKFTVGGDIEEILGLFKSKSNFFSKKNKVLSYVTEKKNPRVEIILFLMFDLRAEMMPLGPSHSLLALLTMLLSFSGSMWWQSGANSSSLSSSNPL